MHHPDVFTLPQAAALLGIDAPTVARMRRTLAGKHIQPRFTYTLYYHRADIEQALQADAANQAGRITAAQLEQATVACTGCDAPLPRVWFVDRCPACGVKVQP